MLGHTEAQVLNGNIHAYISTISNKTVCHGKAAGRFSAVSQFVLWTLLAVESNLRLMQKICCLVLHQCLSTHLKNSFTWSLDRGVNTLALCHTVSSFKLLTTGVFLLRFA